MSLHLIDQDSASNKISVLYLDGMELIFLIVVCIILCFGFVTKPVWIPSVFWLLLSSAFTVLRFYPFFSPLCPLPLPSPIPDLKSLRGVGGAGRMCSAIKDLGNKEEREMPFIFLNSIVHAEAQKVSKQPHFALLKCVAFSSPVKRSLS